MGTGDFVHKEKLMDINFNQTEGPVWFVDFWHKSQKIKNKKKPKYHIIQINRPLFPSQLFIQLKKSFQIQELFSLDKNPLKNQVAKWALNSKSNQNQILSFKSLDFKNEHLHPNFQILVYQTFFKAGVANWHMPI